MQGNGNGNGHSPAPVSSPGGTGAPPPQLNLPAPSAPAKPKSKLPEALERNKFPKGVSGNLKGRPPGSISAPNAIHAILSAPASKTAKFSHLEEFIQIAKARSRKGDHTLTCAILNKWAADQRIPDPVATAPGIQVGVNVGAYEKLVEQQETEQKTDRPSFDQET